MIDIALYLILYLPLYTRNSPPLREVPFGVALGLALVLVLFLKWVFYSLGTWREKDAAPVQAAPST